MFNKFEYEEMLKQCDNTMLDGIISSLFRNKLCLYRKEKMICVQHEVQRRINGGSYE